MSRSCHVLVISHNVLSQSSAMGKTLSSMLSCVPPDCLAQLYFHSEVPTTEQCRNYFRIRDQDVLVSIVTRHSNPKIYGKEDIRSDISVARTDKGLLAKIYQFSRRRTPLIYNVRDLMWKCGKWDGKALKNWVEDFSPDLIFFASGDYVFPYRIAYTISCRSKIPIIMWCCDDFYFSNRYMNTLGGKYHHHNLMKWVRRLSEQIESVVVISEQMKQDYATIFSQPINVIRISAPENNKARPANERSGIVYVGGLGVNRITPLTELGQKLRTEQLPGYPYIDVYTNDRSPQTLAQLNEQNGIRFHGEIAAEKVPEILGMAKYILYVEAFDENSIERTRYSLSTKIGESLRSGACIIAYGPESIASMSYLKSESAAVILCSPEELCDFIVKLDANPSEYKNYIENAQQLAWKNHSKERNEAVMSDILHLRKLEE